MGDYTKSRFVEEITMNLGSRTSLSSPTDWYARLLNQAYLQLCTRDRIFTVKRKIFIPELEVSSTATTTDGTAYVLVPTGCFIIRGIWNSTDDQMLTWITPEQYWEQDGRADTSSEETPTEYTRRGTYIYLYPTPDSSTLNLTIYYKKRPTELSQAAHTTIIGSEWDDIIVGLATINGFYRLQEPDIADAWKKRFVEDVEGVINNIYNERIQANSFIFPDNLYTMRR